MNANEFIEKTELAFSCLTDNGVFSKRDMEQAVEILIGLQAENKNLKTFARHLIQGSWFSGDVLDEYDIQALAEKLGLIVPHIATEDDIDDESDFDVGDTIFRFSGTLKGGE